MRTLRLPVFPFQSLKSTSCRFILFETVITASGLPFRRTLVTAEQLKSIINTISWRSYITSLQSVEAQLSTLTYAHLLVSAFISRQFVILSSMVSVCCFAQKLSKKSLKQDVFPQRIADLGAVLKFVLSRGNTEICLY